MLQAPSRPRTCRHHWIIQPAEGPVSLGVCKFCHDAKEFKNSIDDWNPDKLPIQARDRNPFRSYSPESGEFDE